MGKLGKLGMAGDVITEEQEVVKMDQFPVQRYQYL